MTAEAITAAAEVRLLRDQLSRATATVLRLRCEIVGLHARLDAREVLLHEAGIDPAIHAGAAP